MKKIFLFTGFNISLLLGNIADSNFNYQDYLDFGQNKGRFQVGATGITVKDKKGNIYTIGVPMPDLVGKVDLGGVMTFMGGSYVYTAAHTRYDNANFFGTTYTGVDFEEMILTQGDISYVRYNKFITGVSKADGYLEVYKENNPLENKERYTDYFRSGQGTAMYRLPDGSLKEIQKSGIRTGGIQAYHSIIDQDNYIKIMTDRGPFLSNPSTAGDSGSPLWVWDNQEKKWLVVGAISRSNRNTQTYYAVYRQNFLDTLIQRNTNPTIHLNGSSATWENQNISSSSKSSNASNNKDIVLRGGGIITLNANTDQGSGGIYFDSKEYTIKSAQSSFSWKGAGLHIQEGGLVHWQVKGVEGKKDPNSNRPGGSYLTPPDFLHKIGRGTLSVETFNGGWLNLGEGKVIIDPDDTSKHTFDGIILVSGRATLELVENKGSAFDPNDFFFLFRGGILDVKGNDLIFNTINASDNGANIINTGSKQAKITIDKQMLDLLGTPIPGSGSFLYHGNIGNNILISKTKESQANCPWGKPEDFACYGYEENLLAFDGNIFNPSGGIEHINGKLVFQGHPVIHAYLPEGTAQHVANITGDDIYSTPTRLNQDDWENRIFVLNKITIAQKNKNTDTIKNDSIFILGRNALLLSDIDAQKTQIFFGGEKEIYIDRWDGEGVSTSNKGGYTSYKLQQKLSQGISQKDDSFYFEGNIAGRNNTYIVMSNTNKNPIKFGDFEGIDKHALGLNGEWKTKSVSYQVNLDSTSNFEAKHISLYGANKVIFNTIAPNPNTESKLKTFANFTIENLHLYGRDYSKVYGNLKIQPIQSIADQNITTSITFDNLNSKLYVNGGTLSFAPQTKLYFDAHSTDLMKLTYNTPYPLIITENKIEDRREEKNKDINIFNSKDDQFKLPSFLTPQTLNEEKKISLIFKKGDEPITPFPPFRDYDWFEQYIINVIKKSETDPIQADSKLNEVLGIIGNNRPMMEAIVSNNLNGVEKYLEVFIDSIIHQASEGKGGELAQFASTHTQSAKNVAREGIILTSRLINNISFYNLLRLNLLAQTLKFSKSSQTTSKLKDYKHSALASLKDSFLLSKSDVSSSISELEANILKSRQKELDFSSPHSLWIAPQASYFSIGGKYFNAGVSAGYDYISFANADEFLSLGISLHYSYAEFNQTNLSEQGNGFFVGAYTQYHKDSHEFLVLLYGGLLQEELHHTNSYLSNFASNPNMFKSKKDNWAMLAQAFYKYSFTLPSFKNFSHAIKPIGGVEVSYYWIPSGEYGMLTYGKLNGVVPTLDAGVEYMLSSASTQNIFSALLKYNVQTLKNRKINFGISALPSSLTQTDMQGAWIELSYSGNYAFNQEWSMDYSLLASMSATQPNYFGVSGNIGVSWRF